MWQAQINSLMGNHGICGNGYLIDFNTPYEEADNIEPVFKNSELDISIPKGIDREEYLWVRKLLKNAKMFLQNNIPVYCAVKAGYQTTHDIASLLNITLETAQSSCRRMRKIGIMSYIEIPINTATGAKIKYKYESNYGVS